MAKVKLKPAAKIVLILLFAAAACAVYYFFFYVKEGASGAESNASESSESTSGQIGVPKSVYRVALSEWPGHNRWLWAMVV